MSSVSPPPSATVATPTAPSLRAPNRQDWILLILLVICGGSSFSGIRIAVETASPAMVAAGRLWVSTLVLYLYMRSTGRKMIPWRTEGGKIAPLWKFAAAIGFIGYTIPMALFPYAQQTVSSLLAGIYMAFMPIGTMILAATFADEPFTRQKVIGFSFGTLGVVFLMGPAVLGDIFSANVLAQCALLVAATCYAMASVIMRRAPDAPARSFAVAFMLVAALFATPAALADLPAAGTISWSSWMAIIYLGVVPTGITAIFIIHLIRGAGAGFMAMGNYITPLAAIVFGVILFREQLEWHYGIGLATILTGVAITQPETFRSLLRVVRGKAPKG